MTQSSPHRHAVETEARVSDLFGLDGRAIEVFRRALALVAIYDLYVRAKDFTKFYTEGGVFPLAAQSEMFPRGIVFNLHAWFHHPAWAMFLMAASAALCALIVCGRGNRIAWAAQWVLLLSLQNRNPFVNQGGDVMLRIFFFWGNFLPWRGREKVFSPATFALSLQIAFIYFFAALLKTGADWHGPGSAIYYALSLDKFATPLGLYLRQFPALLREMTHAVWYFELLGPVLLFFPFDSSRVRTASVLAFMALHFGFVLTLRLGTFPWICLAALTVLLPAPFWDALEYRTGRIPTARVTATPLPRLLNAFVISALLGVLLCNLSSVKALKIELPQPMSRVMYPLGIIQKWEMFAPAPPHTSNWLAIEATRGPDEWYDLSRGLAVEPPRARATKPEWLSYQYSSERELKYVEAIAHDKNAKLRPYFMRYVCAQWHGRFDGIRLVQVVEPIGNPLYEHRRTIGRASCP